MPRADVRPLHTHNTLLKSQYTAMLVGNKLLHRLAECPFLSPGSRCQDLPLVWPLKGYCLAWQGGVSLVVKYSADRGHLPLFVKPPGPTYGRKSSGLRVGALGDLSGPVTPTSPHGPLPLRLFTAGPQGGRLPAHPSSPPPETCGGRHAGTPAPPTSGAASEVCPVLTP